MTIFLFILIRIAFIILLGIFVWYLARTQSCKDALRQIYQGFKRGLHGVGFSFPDKQKKIELYQWIPDKEIDVCETSYEYAQRDPMDLASWMEEGLPKSVDGVNTCHKDCQCQLVCSKKRSLNN